MPTKQTQVAETKQAEKGSPKAEPKAKQAVVWRTEVGYALKVGRVDNGAYVFDRSEPVADPKVVLEEAAKAIAKGNGDIREVLIVVKHTKVRA